MFAILQSLPRPLPHTQPATGTAASRMLGKSYAYSSRAEPSRAAQLSIVFRIGEGVKLQGERARVFPKQIGNNFIK